MSHSVLHSHVNWCNISELQIPWYISPRLVDFICVFIFIFLLELVYSLVTSRSMSGLGLSEWIYMCGRCVHNLALWIFLVFCYTCETFARLWSFFIQKNGQKQNHKTEHKFDLKQSFKVQQGLNGIIKYQTLTYGCHLECIFFHRTQPRISLCSKYCYSSGRKMPGGIYV